MGALAGDEVGGSWGAAVDRPGPADATTPLQAAASCHRAECTQRHADAISKLVRAGASKDRTDVNGQTALHTAAYHGNAITLNALLTLGVEVNVKDTRGFTPLDFDYSDERGASAAAEAAAAADAAAAAAAASAASPPPQRRLDSPARVAPSAGRKPLQEIVDVAEFEAEVLRLAADRTIQL